MKHKFNILKQKLNKKKKFSILFLSKLYFFAVFEHFREETLYFLNCPKIKKKKLYEKNEKNKVKHKKESENLNYYSFHHFNVQ